MANALFDAHRDDPAFGYRFLANEATAAGFAVAERTVQLVWRLPTRPVEDAFRGLWQGVDTWVSAHRGC